MTTDVTVFDTWHHIDIHVGGSSGFEEYGDGTLFIRIQCEGGNDLQFWIDDTGANELYRQLAKIYKKEKC